MESQDFSLFLSKLVLRCGMIASADPSALITAAIAPLLRCSLEHEEEKWVLFTKLLNDSVVCFGRKTNKQTKQTNRLV